MNRNWCIALILVGIWALCGLSLALAEDWYLIAPISAAGHSHPFVVYNLAPYEDEDECSVDLASDEFLRAFDNWQENEIMEHKGDVTFGKPICIVDPNSVKAFLIDPVPDSVRS